jgi:hypothetical protein
MVATSREDVSSWIAIVAAMVYLATFLALCFGIYSLAVEKSFLDAFVFAYPRAMGACALLFVCSIAIEACQSAPGVPVTKTREAKRLALHS